jgi:hypothetical protein
MAQASFPINGLEAQQPLDIPEQTYAGNNEPLPLYPSPISRNHSIDSVFGQVSSGSTHAADHQLVAPDSNFNFPANGIQQYEDSRYSRNNSCYNQLAYPASTHRNSTSTGHDGQSSQVPPSMPATSLSCSVHGEYYVPPTSSGMAPYSAEHIGQSPSSQFFLPPAQFSTNGSVDTAKYRGQSTMWETNQILSPSSQGSPLRTRMTASDDDEEESLDMSQPDTAEINIGPSEIAPPHERADPIPCDIEGCRITFGGHFRTGNRQRHVKNFHRGIPASYSCYICGRVYRRDDARRKHEWKKHRRLESKPQKRGRED